MFGGGISSPALSAVLFTYRWHVSFHLPVPKINSPGGADTASGEYTDMRSVARAYVTVVYIQYNEKF